MSPIAYSALPRGECDVVYVLTAHVSLERTALDPRLFPFGDALRARQRTARVAQPEVIPTEPSRRAVRRAGQRRGLTGGQVPGARGGEARSQPERPGCDDPRAGLQARSSWIAQAGGRRASAGAVFGAPGAQNVRKMLTRPQESHFSSVAIYGNIAPGIVISASKQGRTCVPFPHR